MSFNAGIDIRLCPVLCARHEEWLAWRLLFWNVVGHHVCDGGRSFMEQTPTRHPRARAALSVCMTWNASVEFKFVYVAILDFPRFKSTVFQFTPRFWWCSHCSFNFFIFTSLKPTVMCKRECNFSWFWTLFLCSAVSLLSWCRRWDLEALF